MSGSAWQLLEGENKKNFEASIHLSSLFFRFQDPADREERRVASIPPPFGMVHPHFSACRPWHSFWCFLPASRSPLFRLAHRQQALPVGSLTAWAAVGVREKRGGRPHESNGEHEEEEEV